MKNRFKWIQKGLYLVSDNCKYLLLTYRTSRGYRADILDYSFFTIKENVSIEYAKKLARELTV